MNLKEIYDSLSIEKIAEKEYNKALERAESFSESYKERFLARLTRTKTLNSVKDSINKILAQNPNTPSEVLMELMENEDFKVKGLLAANPNTPLDILHKLYEMGYAKSLAKNPNAPAEILDQIYESTINNPEKISGQYDPNIHTLYNIARNPNTSQEVLRELSTRNGGISGSETIKKAVAQNPSTPLEILEEFVKLGAETNVLQNPNIPDELMNSIIDMQDKRDYQFDMDSLPSLYTSEYVDKLKRENGIKRKDYILVKNPTLSPEMLQIIEGNLNLSLDYTHVLSNILSHPNTSEEILKKYASIIDYRGVAPGDLYSVLYSIVNNPNVSTNILSDIISKINDADMQAQKEGTHANCTYAIESILENPNAPKEILTKYIEEAIDEGHITYELRSVLANPTIFETLRDRKVEKTPLQQREEELSSLESETKTILEAEALIEQQKEGQNIGE